MRITAVDALPLAVTAHENSDHLDHTGEALIVRVRTDEGLVGLAECNHAAGPTLAMLSHRGASAMSRGLRELLLGADPLDPGLYDRVYRAASLSARRGLGLGVLNAVDVAIWDLRAQAAEVPLWRLLHGDRARPSRPYATLYSGPGSWEESRERLEQQLVNVHALGLAGVKIEPLEECVPVEHIPEYVALARGHIGSTVELLIDFGHRFSSPEDAARAIDAIAASAPSLIETPLWVDDLSGYARLGALVDVPLAASELYESAWELTALMELGNVDVVQPWVNRVGVTGTLQVIAAASARGRRTLLAGWHATALGMMTSVHVAAGLDSDALALEHAPSEVYGGGFPLRSVAGPEPQLDGDRFRLPERPGVGVELDDERLDFFLARGEPVQ